MFFRRFHNAAFADFSLADFKLRLHERDDIRLRRQQRANRRKHFRQRNERQVNHGQIHLFVEIRRREIAHVYALAVDDARIAHQFPRQLAVADIHRIHLFRAALQEAIRKAAGGRADINRNFSGWIS